MKKFGLGLSNIIPSRSDERHMVPRDMNIPMLPDYSPPPSPYPGRRAPLPSKIEHELRAACLGVLTNQRPSHIPAAVVDEPTKTPVKAQLDYAAIKKSIDKPVDVPTQPSKRRSTMTTGSDDSEANKYAYRPDLPIADLFTADKPTNNNHNSSAFPARTSSLRRPEQALVNHSPHRRTKSGSGSAPLSRTNPSKNNQNDKQNTTQRSGSHETTDSTPSTEYPWSNSTAPTTAGVTPARASKRTSTHMPVDADPNNKYDTNPVDWVRSEVRKRSRRPSEVTKPDDTRSNTRAPSRARSIRSIKSIKSVKSVKNMANNVKDGILDYVRPGSRSRNHSRSGSRSGATPHRAEFELAERGTATRPPPRRDWRNWGRSNKDDGSTSGSVSRANSTRGRSENRLGSVSKPDLNRELPPLPSLTHWREMDRERPVHSAGMKSPTSRSAVVAGVVQPTAVSEKDEIVAARLGSPIRTKPEVYQPTRPLQQAAGINSRTAPHAYTGVARTTDTDREARDGGIQIEFTMDDLIGSRSSTPALSYGHSHSRSISSQTEAVPRTRPPLSEQRSISGSSLSRSISLKKPQAQPVVGSKSTSNLYGTSVPSFSQHRKYDTRDIPPALATVTTGHGRGLGLSHDGRDAKYRHVAEIHASPPVHGGKDDKRAWWNLKSKSKKNGNWMDQLEKLGIRDGVMINDNMAGSPVVRY